jgi:hypothetical protein
MSSGLREGSPRWLVRMKERFRRREPWIVTAMEWFERDGRGGEILPMRQSAW